METSSIKRLIETLALCLVIASVQSLLLPSVLYEDALIYSLAIGLSILAVIELGRRYFFANPETGWPRGWAGPVLVVVACVFGFLFGSSLAAYVRGHPPLWNQDPLVLKTSLLVTVLAAFGTTTYFYMKGRNAWLFAAKQASDRVAAQAQLQRLSSQLQPHMLFNTLANLRVLIKSDPPRAVEMLDRLNAYLRANLFASQSSHHSLQDEFKATEEYLALMQIRMGDRLTVEIDLPSELAHQPILTLLTQALVENALIHGIEPCPEGGKLWIRAASDGKQLRVDIINSGEPLRNDHSEAGQGVGQSLVSERLLREYGPGAQLSLRSLTFKQLPCTQATVSWPIDTSPQP